MGHSHARQVRSLAEKSAWQPRGLSRLLAMLTNGVDRRDRDVRRAAERVVTAVSRVELRSGLRGALAVAGDCVLSELHARRVVLVARDLATANVVLWHAGRVADRAAEPIRFTPLGPQDAAPYFTMAAAHTWSAVRRAGKWELVGFDRGGLPLSDSTATLDAQLATLLQGMHHLVGCAVGRAGEWDGRLFVIDADVPRNRPAALAGVRYLVDRIAAAMDNAYLLHRIRARSAANERTRIARELHDGLIQSVMAVQIQLHALGARQTARSHPIAHDLGRLAAVLRDEALGLRELMQRMQPPELDPDRLVDTIAGIVQRFQHETGIGARFITNVDRLPLPPRACRELAHVVQEALVNVRKHSGAAQVKVGLTHEGGVCLLSIDDDGRGFPFSGRLTAQDAAYEQSGPRVIRDRVHRIGGDLTVVSVPRRGSASSGARLTVSIPLTDKYAIAG
jgi:signal transduction histidine kinase